MDRHSRGARLARRAALSPRLSEPRRLLLLPVLVLSLVVVACTGDAPPVLTFSGSALGVEAEVVRAQLQRFAARHPGTTVEIRTTPDAADQRHQLYVQWLNGGATEPDVLQLDTIWPAEFAAAGWIHPLASFAPDTTAFFPAAVAAGQWEERLYALPWFVDAGLLYWRTDLLPSAPETLAALRTAARAAAGEDGVRYGFVWQGARYEGLVTVFLEYLDGFGGAILDAAGQVAVASPESVEALSFMVDMVRLDGSVPAEALTWQEEQSRFAFQNGDAALMRNWPYAWPLLQSPGSAVAGRVAVAPFPTRSPARRTATLGGSLLAINARSREPQLAWALVDFLTQPEQMLERARLAGQLPARRTLYEEPALADALALPIVELQAALDAAVPRPTSPVYSELSEILQVRLHRALSGQQTPRAALEAARDEMQAVLARSGLTGTGARTTTTSHDAVGIR
ncbi:MAG: ABC transporter substrate-binding protein [Vicinamibacterales bacterium]